MPMDDEGYRTIPLGNGYDVTVTPSNVATVWLMDNPVRTIDPIKITYDHGAGDRNQYTKHIGGREAIEFIITSWIYGRHIIDIQFA